MIVNDYTDLVFSLMGDRSIAFAIFERAIYKGTACGASCQKIDNGVKIGSIVEGVDGDGTQYYDFTFPFETQDFWDAMDKVEKEAVAIFTEHEEIEAMVAWEDEMKYCEPLPEGEKS